MSKFTNEEFAYIVLDSVEGIKANDKRTIIELFDSPDKLISDFLSKSEDIKKIVDEIPFERLSQLITNKDNLKKFYLDFLQFGCYVLCIGMENYPEKLYQLSEPPFVLYYRGNAKIIDNDIVLFSGTRSCTHYGIQVTSSIVKSLVENDITLLSGISDGIDTALIESSLENAGQNIIVAAGGIDRIAPSINSDYAKSVETNGLVMSEYRPDVIPQRFHYLYRNRILAALCDVAVLVEADEESKSLGVINLASDLSKEIFAVPGNLTSKVSMAPNILIANETARALVEPKQIVEIFRGEFYYAPKKVENLTNEELAIVELLRDKPLHIDELLSKIDLTYSEIMTKLFLLEGKKVIRKVAGNCYELI